jgi:hypothetical protein
MWSAPRPLLCNGAVNASTIERLYFLRGPCRGVILNTTGAARQLRVQLWSVNQQATEASSGDIAEEQPLWRAVTE